MLRPVLPAVRPFRAGALCLFAALTLALAAGTFGIGPDGARHGYWNAPFFEPRGGIVGDALLYAVATAVSTIGAHILARLPVRRRRAAADRRVGRRRPARDRLRPGRHDARDRPRRAGAPRRARARPRRAPRRAAPTARRAPRRAVAVPEPDERDDRARDPRRGAAPPEPRRRRGRHRRDARRGARSLVGATRYPDIYGEPLPEPSDEQPHARAAEPTPTPAPSAASRCRARPDEADAEDVDARVQPRRARDARATSRRRAACAARSPTTPSSSGACRASTLLKRSTAEQTRPDTAGQEKTAARLVEALGHFGVEAKIVGTVAGPHITRFELRLAPGIKMSKVAQLKDDLAYALAATDIRILAPIPGKTAVGVEVPNARRRIVQLGDVFQNAPAGWSPLTVWLGKDVAGKAIGADLAKMPHLLVAGTTGAGKSACINAMLSSVLLRATPHELRLVLIDPKQVELNHYESIPHLLTPVITSPRMAANALQNLVREMEQRYSIMSLAKTRSLHRAQPLARPSAATPPLPYILCVIDELADLMMVAPADVEDSIIRLAQKARAVGIHLVLATQSPARRRHHRHDQGQRPVADRLQRLLADRLARDPRPERRRVAARPGRHALLAGRLVAAAAHPGRLHRRAADRGADDVLAPPGRARAARGPARGGRSPRRTTPAGGADDGFSPDEDPLLEDAIRLVVEMGTASTSMLQRRLRLGYTRAGRLIDMLERRGVISGYEGSKPRQVLVGAGDVERFIANLRERGGGRRDGRRSRRGGAPSPPSPTPVHE